MHRLGGAALIVSGVCSALFWVLAALLGTFAGAGVVQRLSWVPAQALHVVGAMLSIFGFMSLYAVERRETGLVGLVGFVLATVGNTLFLADGLVALAIFPALATNAPALLMPSGAMNQGGVLVLFIAIAAINMVGQVLFGFVTWRAAVFPRAAAVLLVAGGLLFNLPPGPLPLIILAFGGVLWSAGAFWLGCSLIRRDGHSAN
jgi:hypothetical protein